ncbi:MAG: diadenylate cyclase CdaA [Planctomycetota bacterium]|nr:diadenylate cyclase CdaA [Planctomycetota bacterium]
MIPVISDFRISDAIEIALLSLAIYGILRFIRSTRGVGVLRGLFLVVIGATVLLGVLDRLAPGGLDVIKYILSVVTPFFALILVVLFQQELRQGIGRFGRARLFQRLRGASQAEHEVHQIAAAARRLANQRIGALVAFEREVSLKPFIEGAVSLDLPVTSVLLETIFYPGSPLHDGGVVISGKSIAAASAIFPLTSNPEVSARLGTRHRAALGLSEETDAVALVVSEETGEIALASAGRLEKPVPPESLERRLQELLRQESAPRKEPAASSAGLLEEQVKEATS